MKFKQLLSRLSKRERSVVYATVVIVFLASTERLVLHPIVSRLNELDEEILLKENRLRRNLRDLAAREGVRNAYSRYAAYALSAGSDEEEMGRLLNEIEGLARKSGLSLVNMKPRPAAKINVGKQYPVEVEVVTEMASLISFMHGLHSSKYLLMVKQLRLAPKGGRTTQVNAYLLISETVIQ
ncbi:MAG: type 4a pilus biogenesis protein PilO [Terriglobia bacterium]